MKRRLLTIILVLASQPLLASAAANRHPASCVEQRIAPSGHSSLAASLEEKKLDDARTMILGALNRLTDRERAEYRRLFLSLNHARSAAQAKQKERLERGQVYFAAMKYLEKYGPQDMTPEQFRAEKLKLENAKAQVMGKLDSEFQALLNNQNSIWRAADALHAKVFQKSDPRWKDLGYYGYLNLMNTTQVSFRIWGDSLEVLDLRGGPSLRVRLEMGDSRLKISRGTDSERESVPLVGQERAVKLICEKPVVDPAASYETASGNQQSPSVTSEDAQ